MGSNDMLYNALSMGKKTPKIASFPWDCVTPPGEVSTPFGILASV